MQADIKEIVKQLRAVDKDVIIVWVGYYNMAATGMTGPAGDFKLTLTEGVAVPKFELDVAVPTGEVKWVDVEGRGVFSKRTYKWKEPRLITETQKVKFGGYNLLKVETPVLIKNDEALLPKQCWHAVNVRINRLHEWITKALGPDEKRTFFISPNRQGAPVLEPRVATADLPRGGHGGQEGGSQGPPAGLAAPEREGRGRDRRHDHRPGGQGRLNVVRREQLRHRSGVAAARWRTTIMSDTHPARLTLARYVPAEDLATATARERARPAKPPPAITSANTATPPAISHGSGDGGCA